MAERYKPPTKLTEEIIIKICDNLRRGLSIKHSSTLAGIDEKTYEEWVKKGVREEKGLWFKFAQAVQQALVESQEPYLNKLKELALAGDFRAIQFFLERRFPKEWGKKDVVRLEDEGTKDSAFNQDNISTYLVDLFAKNREERGE